MGYDNDQDKQSSFMGLLALLIFLIALLAGGIAYWYDGAAKEDAAVIGALRKQIEELSLRPEKCEAPRDVASVSSGAAVSGGSTGLANKIPSCPKVEAEPLSCPEQVCEAKEKIVYVPKKQIVYVDSCPKRKISSLPLNEVERVVENDPVSTGCQGPKIVLNNKEILENTVVGSFDTCEIILPSASYVRVIGNVKLIAQKITINGVINGNAIRGETLNAAKLELEAVGNLLIKGSVDLRGAATPNPDKKITSTNKSMAFVPEEGGYGGTLILKGKRVHLLGMINVGGAVPPKKNGQVFISSLEWDQSIVLLKNIINYKNVKRLAFKQ